MALIKCSECGKQISDKAKKCIHCGSPIEKELKCKECGEKINKNDLVCKNCGISLKDKEIKNIFINIWIILCAAICFVISGCSFFSNILNISISYFTIDICGIVINTMGIIALLLGCTYIILLKNLSKKNFTVLAILNGIVIIYNILVFQTIMALFFIVCAFSNLLITFLVVRKKLNANKFQTKELLFLLIALIVGIFISFINSNDYNSDDYDSDNYYEDTRTAKEKLIDYLKENENANCNSSKCTFTFSLSDIGYVDYYTLDFEKKKFIDETYITGSSYVEYDYGKNTGYSKDVSTVGWTVTTTMNVTFDNENGTYHWDCNSTLNGYCKSSGETISDIIVNLRDRFYMYCDYAGIDASEL